MEAFKRMQMEALPPTETNDMLRSQLFEKSIIKSARNL